MDTEEIATKIMDVMVKEAKPLRPGDIAKIAGIDSKEVSKAIKYLKQKEKIYSPKRCYYSPKQ